MLIDGLCKAKELRRAIDLYMALDVQVIKKFYSVTSNKLRREGAEKLDLEFWSYFIMQFWMDLSLSRQGRRSPYVVNAMVDAQTSQWRVDDCEADKLFRMKTVVRPNAELFTTIVYGLCKTKELDKASVLLPDMIGIWL